MSKTIITMRKYGYQIRLIVTGKVKESYQVII